ncbi:MlaD family protein [Gordonia sp. LSe1-13]|uniref:MlaD family protein n=1 Tax=Gordonia sesuvii TaxID=3116777 RepID=A0ABU7M933_9ACTN|nr:MlaD family protein [Gordonia sp. LSe1-13]
MLTGPRNLLSRRTVAVATVAVVGALAVSGYTFTLRPADMHSYCALMPDSIGLYEKNHVSVLGMPIGAVTSIRPEGTAVRIDFEIDADRRLPTDVGATTVARTLMADRELTLIGNEPAMDAPTWDSQRCITKTATPKSISETLAAFSELSEELNGDPRTQDLSRALAEMEKGTSGTGDDINRIILGLGRALDSPDAAIGRLGNILTDVSDLSDSVAGGWADIKKLLTRFPATMVGVNQFIIGPSVETIARLRYVLPMFNDITTMFGGRIVHSLEANANLPQLINAQVGSLREAIGMIPVFDAAFRSVTDPDTGAAALTYAAPAAPVPSAVGAEICRSLGRAEQPDCTTPAPLTTLIPLLLGSEQS